MRDRSYEYNPVIRTPTVGGGSEPLPIPGAPNDPRQRKARLRGAAALVLVFGLAAGIGLFAWSAIGEGGLFDVPDAGVGIPGESRLHIEAGEHLVWYERTYRSSRDPNIRCAFAAPSGAAVDLRPASTDASYSHPGVEGWLVWEITAAESGSHFIRCSGDAGRLLVGSDDHLDSSIAGVLAGFAIAAISVITSIVLFVRSS